MKTHKAKSYLSQTWLDPRVVVGISPIDGKGLFAAENIKMGEVVMIWGGVLFPKTEYKENAYHEMTIVTIDKDHYLGVPLSVQGEQLDVYLNHSCDPSTWLIDEVTVVARRDIKKGEEITLDQATWNDDEDECYAEGNRCLCGQVTCRKVLTAQDWMKPELQKRYAGHFSPYLADQIRKVK